MEDEAMPEDIPEGYKQRLMEKERSELEQTVLGFWGSWIRRNWKLILIVIGGGSLGIFLLLTKQLLILFGLAIFAVASGFGYFFWRGLISVPRIAVLETQNKNRRSNLFLIPKNLFPNFEIVGTPVFLKDVDSDKDILPADFVDLDQGFIKCAYDFDVSNLNLAYNDESINISENRAVDMIRKNQELNEMVDRDIRKKINPAQKGERRVENGR